MLADIKSVHANARKTLYLPLNYRRNRMIEKNPGGRGVKSTERDAELLAACAKGDKTRQETADEFGISRCRLLQILRKYKAGAV